MNKIAQLLKAEMKRQAEGTRRALERVPDGKDDWKPHEKSMPLGYLASLLAVMPSWEAAMINLDELDIATPGEYQQTDLKNTEERLKAFDKAVADASAAFDSITDEKLLETNWKLLVGGQVAAEQTRYEAITENTGHIAHHRGQLTVYLRLLDIPVPSLFGPTADEKPW